MNLDLCCSQIAQNFSNMEFALKYGIRELLRHERIPETHVLATLLTVEMPGCSMEKRSCACQVSISYFRIFRFLRGGGGAGFTQVISQIYM